MAKNAESKNPDQNVNQEAMLGEAAQKAVEKVIATAEEKAAEIIAAAEKKATQLLEQKEQGQNVTEQKKAVVDNSKGEELVEVTLFKDNNLYKDDVYVAVNGEGIKIQRGKKVKIKRKFADAIEHSLMQDAAAADLSVGLQEEYENKSNAFN